ncbi:hypothetical protein M408DRAFT_73274 [Serendipita vermifera MAFF 305830]|uniref:Methyltransferase type 11 domain-containing protein n=1 Tax=Serendipita vermifera MAFF 305830 TaxID=933852 RepID=A0A0C3B3G0_SERVB|nr:hypothetical protein M408DRAFT_73274 [Serendipita vermifera MAFF 305830]
MSNSRAVVSAPEISDDASEYEKRHVHAVYDEIASHFSSTRYKPWPIVATFISSLMTGSVGLDLGCGNGKYLSLPSENPSRIRTIGVDRSINLLGFARTSGVGTSEVVLGDVIQLPWRAGTFDFVISIATIHHLATHSRRILAVKVGLLIWITIDLLSLIQTAIRAVTPHGGRILIYVWAMEQDESSKRVIPGPLENSVPSRQGVDVFVPWVHSTNSGRLEATTSSGPTASQGIYNRYYHMFAEGELGTLVRESAKELGLSIGKPTKESGEKGLTIVQEGWERSNYYIELLSWQNT